MKIEIIPTKDLLYDKCENMEQLYDKYYYPLLVENKELEEQIEEVEFIVGLRQKRNLISKFDKEYDEEDKKKNPNRDYAGIMPDAEEVYRRYYTMKNQQQEFIKYLEDEIKRKRLNATCIFEYNDTVLPLEEILQKYKEMIGVSK